MKRQLMGMCDNEEGQDLRAVGPDSSLGVDLGIRLFTTKQQAAMEQNNATWKMLKPRIAHQEKLLLTVWPMCYRAMPTGGSLEPHRSVLWTG